MKIGELEIIPISDGEAKMPPGYFPNADWSVHQDLLNEEGVLVIPLGCFLVRTAGTTVLVDAGLGPVESPFMNGGNLPGGLEAAGTKPSDIDIVLCTHLHIDHIGWLVREGMPFFPNARVRFSVKDWDHFVVAGDKADFTRQAIEVLDAAGGVDVIHEDTSVTTGVDTLHAPGHTPGHLCVVLSSGTERAVLLGDAITCPIQVQETEWQAISDVDPDLARQSRESLFRELETSGSMTVAAHFPGLQFGRVLAGKGKRYFA
jgi:glyoxylase-like metal-dependent hydrolase (beta-lactamase superfamily II)